MASAEHPETNGLVERLNRSLSATLAAFVNVSHMDWDEKLSAKVFAINTAKQKTTEITPFELVYGREPRLPHELAFPEASNDKEGIFQYLSKITR